MAIQGSLGDMSLATLIQSLLQENVQAQVELRQQDRIAQLYLDSGRLCYAVITGLNNAPIQYAEEVVYELLSWSTGEFTVERDIPPPSENIAVSWDFLLMEGLRHLDEKGASTALMPADAPDLFTGLSDEDAAELQTLLTIEEAKNEMASKSDQIQEILTRVVNESGDLNGAVVVSNDGLIMGSVLGGAVDGNRIGAVSAGLLSLAGRSAQQLNQGDLVQTLIQATNGNIIAVRSGNNASFVGLTGTNVNLGMVFLECGDAAKEIGQIL
jgi:predicted regulator of Ras-like GTPase activity (Roadblock/LC7/MglB family)